MATTLYMTNAAAGVTPPGGTGATYNLTASAGSGTCVKATATGAVTPPTDGTRWSTVASGGSLMTWLSPTIKTAVTISNTVTISISAQESNGKANAAWYGRVGKLTGSTYSWIGNASNLTEFGTSASTRTVAITPTSTSFAVNDRIVMEVHMDDATGVTMASGYTLTITLGANSFVTTTDTVDYIGVVPLPANSLILLGAGV